MHLRIAKNCDDNSVCTSDSCDAADWCMCEPPVVGIFYCNDNNACAVDDTCKLGVCTGKILQCYDGLDCTQDSCDKGTGCTFAVQDKAPCSDGSACTLGDTCAKDKCIGAVKTCEDNNDCTIDTCDSAIGNCNFTANDGYYCSDNNACTSGDVCKGTKCTGTTIICNDGNTCTSDSCNQKTGCVFIPTPNAPCDDNDKCSTDEICQQSVCKAKPVICNDDNTCSKDSCDKATGKCVFQTYNDSYQCDDSDPCTTADICLAGQCKGSVNACNDSNACTVDACNQKTGSAVIQQNQIVHKQTHPLTREDFYHGSVDKYKKIVINKGTISCALFSRTRRFEGKHGGFMNVLSSALRHNFCS